jgi:hypothetical protein
VAKSEPHPIYGATPMGRDGFTLERQSLPMLNFWHEKASALKAAYEATMDKAGKDIEDDDATYNVLYETRWDIFEAAFKARATRAGDLDFLFRIIVRHMATFSNDEEETPLTQTRVTRLAEIARKAAEPTLPKKEIGRLARGTTLTRAGLLYRYQAFLIQELETVGWNLYGEAKFAFTFRIEDDAVNQRVKHRCSQRRRKAYPFFDENTLTTRARSVLKSLKIDTERTTDPVARKARKGGSR